MQYAEGEIIPKAPLPIGETPLQAVEIQMAGLGHEILFKLEGANPFGSIKDRVAWGLVHSYLRCPAAGDFHVLDASSGNYGAALAGLGRVLDFRVTIVAPPKIASANAASIRSAGAELIITDGDYADHARRIASDRGATHLDQYNNPLNPRVHERWTAPEALRDAGSVNAVFLATSSGGTARGFMDYLNATESRAALVIVDLPRSGAVQPTRNGCPPWIPGFGSARRISFDLSRRPFTLVSVPEEQISAAVALDAPPALPRVGLSAIGVFLGALVWLRRQTTEQRILLVCADGQEKYQDELLKGPEPK